MHHRLQLIVFLLVLSLGGMACRGQGGEGLPRLLEVEGQTQIQLSPGTAPFPVGLYVMMRPGELFQGGDGPEAPIVRIAAQPFVQGIAMGLSAADLHPTAEGGIDFEVLTRCLERVELACRQAGRERPLPLFFKPYFDRLPGWMMADVGSVDEPTLVRNRLGMKVIRHPAWVAPTGRHLPQRDSPLSTDPAYHAYIREVVAHLAAWLDEHDPDTIHVPLIHYAGPAMSSNQMRVPLRDVFLDAGEDTLGAGWTKQGHIDAWCRLTDAMAAHPALTKRCWVFNMANLSAVPQHPEWLKLSTADQVRVLRALESLHPDGAAAVMVKVESLCVNFNRRQSTDPFAEAPMADFRFQMRSDPTGKPYDFIARRRFGHGWENWSAFHPGREDRAPSLYPFQELVENALYLDLDQSSPSQPQGTLWVEIWFNEAAAPDVRRFDEQQVPLAESLEAFDTAIRGALRQALERGANH